MPYKSKNCSIEDQLEKRMLKKFGKLQLLLIVNSGVALSKAYPKQHHLSRAKDLSLNQCSVSQFGIEVTPCSMGI